MFVPRIPFRPIRMRRRAPWALVLALAFLAACGGGDSSGPDDGGTTGTLSGTVHAAGAAGLAGATVSVGGLHATTDANGRFELTGIPVGAAAARAERPGYLAVDATVSIVAGANNHDFSLTAQEIYVSGANAVYVPPGVTTLRGAIVALGGPSTSGFVTGERIEPDESNVALEASLQALGASLRAAARTAHVVLLGSRTIAMENSTASDNAVFAALSTAAQMSGHPEIADAPVLMFGLSAGGRETAGLVARHPERSIGLLERVPASLTDLTEPAALAVPTFVMQAELDEVVNNVTTGLVFAGNRSRGGLWSLAVEPGVGHHVATARANTAATDWILNALALRLPATPGQPLIALPEASGWLGNQTTLQIAPWADYGDDRTKASWTLSQSSAASWKLLGTATGGGT